MAFGLRSRTPARKAPTGSSPGSAARTPCCASLLESGFVIPEQDIFMATSPDLVDPLRHHYHPGFG